MCKISLFSCYSTFKSRILSVASTNDDLKIFQNEFENLEKMFEKEVADRNFYPVLWTYKQAAASIGRSLDTFQDDVKLWIQQYGIENLPWLVEIHKSKRIEPIAFRKWFQKKNPVGRPSKIHNAA